MYQTENKPTSEGVAKETSDRRLHYLDVVKGIGILLVVITHAVCPFPDFVRWVFSFHMPLFFIVSGIQKAYAEAKHTLSIGQSILQRTIRLLWPYFTFSAVSLLFCLLNQFVLGESPDYKDVIFRSIILEGQLTLWFLPALLIAEIAYELFQHFRLLRPIPVIITAFITILLAKIIQNNSPTEAIWIHLLRELNFLNRGMIGFVLLAMGYALFHWLKGEKTRQNKSAKTCAAILMVAACVWLSRYCSLDLKSCAFSYGIPMYLLAFASSAGIIYLAKEHLPQNASLEFWGKNSLTVMAVHLNCSVLLMPEYLLQWSGIHHAEQPYLFFVLQLAFGLIACWGLIHLVNRKLSFLLCCPASISDWIIRCFDR